MSDPVRLSDMQQGSIFLAAGVGSLGGSTGTASALAVRAVTGSISDSTGGVSTVTALCVSNIATGGTGGGGGFNPVTAEIAAENFQSTAVTRRLQFATADMGGGSTASALVVSALGAGGGGGASSVAVTNPTSTVTVRTGTAATGTVSRSGVFVIPAFATTYSQSGANFTPVAHVSQINPAAAQDVRQSQVSTSDAWYMSIVAPTVNSFGAGIVQVKAYCEQDRRTIQNTTGMWWVEPFGRDVRATGSAYTANVITGTVGSPSSAATALIVSDIGAAAGLTVTVSSLPAVSISAMPAVSVSAIVSELVSVSAIPAISVSANPSQVVSVSALPAVNVGTFVATAVTAQQGSSGATTQAWIVQGAANTTSAITGNPIPVAVLGASTLPASNTAGRAMYLLGDTRGRLVARRYVPALRTAVTFSTTGSASASILAAPGAGIKLGIVGLDMFNADSVIQAFSLLAGATNSVTYQGYLPANAGGFMREFAEPLELAANTGLFFQMGANAGTNGVRVNLQYVTVDT